MVFLLFVLDRCHCEFLGSRNSGRRRSRRAAPHSCDVNILNHDFTTDSGRDDLDWVLSLVVHMSQGVVELEVRVSDGAGAEEDRDGN